MNETATPSGATVDAPASMDSILSEFEAGGQSPGDTEEAVVQELVDEAENGDSDPAEPQGTKTQEEADEDDTTDANAEAEESAEEQPEGEDEPEPTYKVKVAGKEVDVPLSELVKGYSRERDYTAKTMALADEKRSLEATLSRQFADDLKQQVELFEQLDPILSQADQIDWQKLAQDDPTSYVQLKAAVDERKAAVTEARKKIEAANAKAQEEATATAAAEAQAETAKLVEKLPELATEDAMKAFAGNAVNYLRNEGFADDEIMGVVDHRQLVIVDKARRFDEMQKAQSTLPAKKVVPRSTVRPLKSDASGSSAPKPRFPSRAPRERQLEHVVQQILQQE